MTDALEYAHLHAMRFEAEYRDLLRIPSVSTQPEHAADVERAAQWIQADMQRSGLTRTEIFRLEGSRPLVYGEWLGAGPDAPTVLLYSHYDVQPAAVEDGWDSDPFEPVQRDGKIYARGAVDSKAHVVANLKAIEALLLGEGALPVNLKLLFEGEEESDSGFIFDFVQANPDLLKADVCAISDGSMPDPDQPSLTVGLRGIVTMELVVTGPSHDLHSGGFGGAVHNPIQALAAILAQLHDETGRVTVPGFYDAVRPLDDAARAQLAEAAPWFEEGWAEFTGAPGEWGEPGYTLLERIGARPTLEFNGIAGGFYGEGFKTVLPARAIAKLSCRLVPDQDPARIVALLRDHIAALTPPTVRSELRQLEAGAPGVLLDTGSPAMQAARKAYAQGWGRAPILLRAGGSVPVVDAFKRELNIPLVPLSYGYRGCGAHGPNEYMILAMFHKGIATAIHFYRELAAQA